MTFRRLRLQRSLLSALSRWSIVNDAVTLVSFILKAVCGLEDMAVLGSCYTVCWRGLLSNMEEWLPDYSSLLCEIATSCNPGRAGECTGPKLRAVDKDAWEQDREAGGLRDGFRSTDIAQPC